MAVNANAPVRYRLNGRTITAPEGDMVRASEGTPLRLESNSGQASAMSAPLPSKRFDALPMTEVRLERLDVRFAGDGTAKVQRSKKPEEIRDEEPEPIAAAFSQSNEAFASMPLWSGDSTDAAASLPFAFEPEYSPVLISGVQSAENDKQPRPVRNANVYRRVGVRVPAEIFEKETVAPRPDRIQDASGMAPAADGAVRGTEVRLPSSALGIGMASDYQPEKNTF